MTALRWAAEAALFAASLIGFLLHNWPPAKIFLGDAGSLTIGFVLGALTLEACLKTTTAFALALPLVEAVARVRFSRRKEKNCITRRKPG